MHGSYEQFISGISPFLGGYYLSLGLMNAVAALILWQRFKDNTWAMVWLLAAGIYVGILAPFALQGLPFGLPQWFRTFVNDSTGPVIYSVGTLLVLGVCYVFRGFFVRPMVAFSLLNLSALLMGLSMTDRYFAMIVSKADNVPIVGLVFLLGFFTWLAAYKAVRNDARFAEGLPPEEKLDNEKVLVWPDLVYSELICMIALTAFLLLWGILLQAPLEEPASAVKTPNPSKAPWYFLGLQEMLVYFDPWMAGVVLPSLIVVGLMAIPYLDFNKLGNGYYTIKQREFSYLTFQFGFLVLWITLIILGTFLRGPNWNFYGPYEYWDTHKVEALNNVDLADIVWRDMLDRPKPKAPVGAGAVEQLGYILVRELPGILLTIGYFALLPPLFATTVFRRYFVKMGFLRFMTMMMLFLFMALLPLKMLLRWTVNLKYIIAIPEYFLNL